MESSTVGLIATTFVTLLSGITVFFSPFAGGISALMHYLPSAALSVASGISAANFVLANGCCICRYPSFLVPWHYLDEPMCQPSKRRSRNGMLIDKQKIWRNSAPVWDRNISPLRGSPTPGAGCQPVEEKSRQGSRHRQK